MKIAVVLVGLLAAMLSGRSGDDVHAAPTAPPNILFVIMDDVGIDQMSVFGYGGAPPPSTPNLAEIANAGIRFRNTWAMPACSTSRAVFFDARVPFRTNVLGALGPADLANSMVSPYERTTPKLLATKGYVSALFGKFHLALQGNNPRATRCPAIWAGTTSRAGWTRPATRPRSTRRPVVSLRPGHPTPAASCPARGPVGRTLAPATCPTAPAVRWRAEDPVRPDAPVGIGVGSSSSIRSSPRSARGT
jgi:hypothetical protein